MSYLIQQGVEIRVARAELLADGRKRLTRFISFKQNGEFPLQLSYAYGDLDPFNGTFPTGWDDLRLVKVEADNSPANNGAGNDPVLAVTYESPGTVTQRDDTGNNGALLTRTIVSFYTTPATPSGYTLVSENVENVNGYPYKAYKFVKGTGEISRQTSYNQSDDVGVTGVTVVSITHLTAPAASDPTSSPGAGYVKISSEPREADGHRIWQVVYAKGTGTVSELIGTRQDGLREVTYVSLGSRTAPSGIVIQDDKRLADGYEVFTVTSMQEADGGNDPTTVSLSWERYVPFTYPGRAKAWVETVGSQEFLDVFLSPPVETLVEATVTVTYQTASTMTISDFWNPSTWATMRATWVGAYGVAATRVQALKGYRTTSATAVTLAGTGYDEAIFGYNIFNGTTARITVTGGPSDPGGNTYTLSAELEPAFTSSTGTQYYRLTKVVATIPAQASLPV